MNYSDLKNSCDIGLSTVIISKKLLLSTSLFPKLKTKEDYVLWLSIARKGLVFKSFKKSMTKWTNRPTRCPALISKNQGCIYSVL